MDAKRIQFPELTSIAAGARIQDKSLGDIPVEVNVELGRTHMTLKEILDLREGTIIELDRLAGEALDLKVSGQLVAQGEVIAVDDCYGLKITTVYINK